jgi:hypothetical protein
MKDRPRALAVLIAIFLIGTIIGVAGSYLWLRPSDKTPRPFDGRPPAASDAMPRSDFPELRLSPELTPGQKEQWAGIFKETREKMDVLGKEQRERMNEFDAKRNNIWKENDQKLRAVLNDEQKVVFDEWVEKKREWMEKAPRRKGPETPKEKRRKPERP